VPITVVIVDDHTSFRAMARAVLADDGFCVVGEAADAESGLAVARELRRIACCWTFSSGMLMGLRWPRLWRLGASVRPS
jgi:CheY-like chemotaxis protein